MGAAVCGKMGYPPNQRSGGSPPLLWGQAQGGYLPFFFFAFFANVLASFSWKMDGSAELAVRLFVRHYI